MGQADINSKDTYGRTPLLFAARKGHEAVVELLLTTGQANINSKDVFGLTPLSSAAENGHEAVVNLLQGYARSHPQSALPSFAVKRHSICDEGGKLSQNYKLGHRRT
ncbi:hypothetical protein TRIATDRAFT_302393 [Trichoderma atroviride IMI 206040]|uniref:Uncharacterized protein n=1 Tax=Hypocrea atroviridis (strain ATCC 20476 / IMI 206040) TaxID=452589 RepID=G9P5Y4_HYPAI|nr:uncharacterized protein TRIATDRAFT_302393 [Trichoderma atroviride IMI 206040]EHK42208.1 hypothetical protein TRIATDRAFT_302393 [Trichoderma atroviride IMI 206040]